MRIINSIIFCLLANGAFAWPLVFANGHFANGHLSVGVLVSSGGGSVPADGYESSLYAYYNFDQTTSPATDVAHGRNLPQGSCGTIASGNLSGFFGNSYQINCNVGRGTPKVVLRRIDDGSGSFKFSSSFTVRFWIKTDFTGASFKNIVGESYWNVYLGADSGDGKIDFFISGNDDPDIDLASNETVNDNAWHRVICWFDASGSGSAGVQIDNHTPATVSTVDIFSGGAGTDSLDVGDNFGDSPDVDCDEVAIWKDYVLTSDDRLFDWNSGAGQTYPLP
jgi:hypothetical protein